MARREVKVGLGPPQGRREEQPGASRPLGKASTLRDNWLVGRNGRKSPELGNSGDKGPQLG